MYKPFDYEARVRELEAEGLCTSDAQSVADVEESRQLEAQVSACQ